MQPATFSLNDKQTVVYETFLLGTANPLAELPLIVPLHFMGSSPSQIYEILLSNVGFLARVIAPYGLFSFEDQYSWFPESLYEESEEKQGKFVDSLTDILLKNVGKWQRDFPTRGQPIFLGVSQGGDICFTLAARHGDRFRLCVPIAGRLLTNTITGKPKSGIVRIHHGVEDPIVPIATAHEAAKKLQSAKLNVTIQAYEGVSHAVPAEMQHAIHNDILIALNKTT